MSACLAAASSRLPSVAWLICVALALLSGSASTLAAESSGRLWVLIGTYTGPKSEGIYRAQLDLATGKLSDLQVAAKIANPSFLAVHPGGRLVYCVNEVSDQNGKKGGAVTAFSFDPATGALTQLNQQSTIGAGPCHLVVDATGGCVLAANYGGGSVCAFPVKGDGSLDPASSFIQHTGSSVNPQRQKEPHAHSINVDPSNRFAVAADLGIDRVLVYRLDPAHGKLTPHDPPFVAVSPGSGPRHFAFHPGGRFGYVINEIDLTVTAFAFDPDKGTLTAIQTVSTLPAGAEKQGSTAEVRVHPTGRFLYGSNRGHDTIVVYAIDQQTGKLTWVENESTGGKTPRNFFVEPSGRYLLAENQSTGSVVVLRINQDTGALEPAGSALEVTSPVCIRTIPIPE